MKSYMRATLGTVELSARDPCTASVMTQDCHICGSVTSPRRAGLPPDAWVPHNGGVTNQQMASACPRCGSTDAVHSIQELAALASSQLGQLSQSHAQPQAGP